MRVTIENIDQVKVDGWLFCCCECDLEIADEETIAQIKQDLIDGEDWGWHYNETKEEALNELR
jgi:hypothetical protein